ncbi:unnamed protein product [Fusarium graminearum]|nr:unnamed protein product [Fusarium graminearum]CAG2000750.1 unnamed protein product [Fusarium graminearum]VTO93293.1 unnamed protein product [Fusarium graminearum]
MRSPGIAKTPCAILVAVEDTDLAIYRAGRAAIAIGVECDGLDEIFMAMLKVEVECWCFLAW